MHRKQLHRTEFFCLDSNLADRAVRFVLLHKKGDSCHQLFGLFIVTVPGGKEDHLYLGTPDVSC